MILKRYNEFLLEELKLTFNNDFKMILKKINNDIASTILLSSEYNVLPDDFRIDEISIDLDNPGNLLFGKTKQSIKIGRFIRSIYDKQNLTIKDFDLEEFVNIFKAEVNALKGNNILEIVNGELIRKFYKFDNYYNGAGTLGNSCMRYNSCQTYFDIYVDNPDVCTMLVLYSDENKTNIKGRALIWNCNIYLTDDRNLLDVKFMDRVYVNEDSDLILFINYANENGIYHKDRQNSNEYFGLMLNDKLIGDSGDEDMDFNISVQLNPKTYTQYPYLDTLKFYNKESHILYSSNNADYDCVLEETDGSDGTTMECMECDGRGFDICNPCDGSGLYTDDYGRDIPCPYCHSEGEKMCEVCDGTGRALNT